MHRELEESVNGFCGDAADEKRDAGDEWEEPVAELFQSTDPLFVVFCMMIDVLDCRFDFREMLIDGCEIIDNVLQRLIEHGESQLL